MRILLRSDRTEIPRTLAAYVLFPWWYLSVWRMISRSTVASVCPIKCSMQATSTAGAWDAGVLNE
jgi:hypothetical protein